MYVIYVFISILSSKFLCFSVRASSSSVPTALNKLRQSAGKRSLLHTTLSYSITYWLIHVNVCVCLLVFSGVSTLCIRTVMWGSLNEPQDSGRTVTLTLTMCCKAWWLCLLCLPLRAGQGVCLHTNTMHMYIDLHVICTLFAYFFLVFQQCLPCSLHLPPFLQWIFPAFPQVTVPGHRLSHWGCRAHLQLPRGHLHLLHHLHHHHRLLHDEHLRRFRHRHIPGARRARI